CLFAATHGRACAERMGRRCQNAPQSPPAHGRAQEDRMSLFGKLVRGATAAASVAIGAASATAQQPVPDPAPLGIPGLSYYPGQTAPDPVTTASGFGRRAAPAPCYPCTPTTPCPITGQPLSPQMGPQMMPPTVDPMTGQPMQPPV